MSTTQRDTGVETTGDSPSDSPSDSPVDQGSTAQRERRKRILDATYDLASEGGFDAVQMRAVADQADVALGTLYRYFPSKIHLLVSALRLRFESTEQAFLEREMVGDTPTERVITMMKRTTRGMQGDPKLTEALTRAFMFADASVAEEIHGVGMSMTNMLIHAMEPERQDPATDDDIAIARVIGDVWLSALVSWVTGRSTPAETGTHIETAVRLLLRD